MAETTLIVYAVNCSHFVYRTRHAHERKLYWLFFTFNPVRHGL